MALPSGSATGPRSVPIPAVRRVQLADFRTYPTLRLDLAGRHVVLTGPNGAGKTNLLEAISLLSPGRGLRRARLAEVGRQDSAGQWAVAARVALDIDEIAVGTGLPV